MEAAGLAKNASNAEGNENVQTQHGAHTSTPSLLVVDEIINTVSSGTECVHLDSLRSSFYY